MMKSQRLLSALALLLAFFLSTTTGFSANHASQSTARRRVRLHVLASPLWVEEDSSITCDDDDSSSPTSSNNDPLTHANGDLPTVIQQIVDERQEFNMMVGKAMDTLRKDMPEILRKSPDFSIYHSEISVIDPSGVRLSGLGNYKSAIAFFQTFLNFWFSSSSRLQYRMVYDFCRSSIRISWNMVLIPKLPLGRPLFLDGVSHYKLDASSGKITEHKIENLVMNDTPVAPPYGIFSVLQQQEMMNQRQGVPVGAGIGAM